MIDKSQTQAGDARACAQHSNRQIRKLPKLVSIRPWALLRRQRMNIAADKEGMIVRARPFRSGSPDVGMRALPRLHLDSMILSRLESVGISPTANL